MESSTGKGFMENLGNSGLEADSIIARWVI
jgi:hypothetical protein